MSDTDKTIRCTGCGKCLRETEVVNVTVQLGVASTTTPMSIRYCRECAETVMMHMKYGLFWEKDEDPSSVHDVIMDLEHELSKLDIADPSNEDRVKWLKNNIEFYRTTLRYRYSSDACSLDIEIDDVTTNFINSVGDGAYNLFVVPGGKVGNAWIPNEFDHIAGFRSKLGRDTPVLLKVYASDVSHWDGYITIYSNDIDLYRHRITGDMCIRYNASREDFGVDKMQSKLSTIRTLMTLEKTKEGKTK